jgi:hypothetical protein
VADDLSALVASGDFTSAAGAVFIGLAGLVFSALMWLRLFRWTFSLFGVKV